MREQGLLDEALEKGVISAEQRAQLHALEGQHRVDGQENFRSVSSLNDIFVLLGTVLLVNALNGLVGTVTPPIPQRMIQVGICWIIALWFHDGKRFRLPIFYAAASAAYALAAATTIALVGEEGMRWHLKQRDVPLYAIVTPLSVGLVALVAGAARFRIPFFMVPIGILATLIVTIIARYGEADGSLAWVLGSCGLAIIATAIYFDMNDPKRLTRWSDFAFWSYVVGSPLFVHSLFLSMLYTSSRTAASWDNLIAQWQPYVILTALVMIVTFAALLLNRRALIISTLAYVGMLTFQVIRSVTGDGQTPLLISILLIGGYIIALGARWTNVRRYVMTHITHRAWFRKLPPY